MVAGHYSLQRLGNGGKTAVAWNMKKWATIEQLRIHYA
jgi:hypothetical protein